MEAAAAIVFTILMIIAFIVWFCFIIGFYLAMFGLFILILTGWVGALIYYLMIKRPADHLAAAQTA